MLSLRQALDGNRSSNGIKVRKRRPL